MAGLIPQSFIDDLLDRVDIVDVVSDRVDLRKSGKNHSACCPFHDEKSPSFTVSPDKQFFYCFGCGSGGNAIGFVMDFDRVDFPEAVERIARQVGVEVPREAGRNDQASQRRKTLYDINEKADRFYRSQLRQHPAATSAVEYLKQRGLSGEIARNFGIGFAPPGWDNLLQAEGTDDTAIELLKESGLLVAKPEENKLYDRFRHRIMFPIRDVRGRTIGFGGRVLDNAKPKYLNSPETPLFHKGRELYGLFEANRQLRDIANLLVVEGYMDVVALAQHSIHNAVATLGTAATAEHLDKLFRYTSEVVFCFDGDNAGRKAASRALETTLPTMLDGRSARFLFLPEGEDPDTLVRKIGTEKFLALIKNATPLADFLFQSLSEDLDAESLDGRARLSKLAAPLINKMPQGVFRELMLKALSERTGVELDSLKEFVAPTAPPVYEDIPAPDYGEMPDYSDQHPNQYPEGDDHYQQQYDADSTPLQRAPLTRPAKKVKLPPERTLIALLANHPQLAQLDVDVAALQSLENDDIEMFLELRKLLHQQPDYSLNHIIAYWMGIRGQEQATHLAEIAATDLLRPVGGSVRDNQREFQDILNNLLKQASRRLPGLALMEKLAAKEAIDDHDLKTLYAAWAQLPKTEQNEETKRLFNQIVTKPRRQ